MQIFTWKQRFIVLSTNILVILVFGGVGFFLDRQFGTAPGFLVGLVLASFPVGQIILVKVLKRHLEKNPWQAETPNKKKDANNE